MTALTCLTLWLSTVLAAVTPGVPLGLPPAALQAKVSPNYRTYQVKKGDTLFSIAERFYGTGHGTWSIIARENGVTPKTLKPGMILRIPLDPRAAFTQKGNAQGNKRAASLPGPTVGDTMDAVGKRIRVFLKVLGVRFQSGPTYPFHVVLLLFLCFILYVLADAFMVWLGSLLVRAPEPTFSRAGKVAVGSAGLQILFVLSLLMIAAVVNQIWPATANLENLRALSWHSQSVWYSALLSLFLAFFFIPLTMAKQTYGVRPGKAGALVFLALALKCFVALFPSAVAFVATGAGVA